MTGGVHLGSDRSFLGPMRPGWGDLLRFQTLRDMEQVIQVRISALEARPDTAKVREEIELARQHLAAVNHEMSQLENLFALL